MNRVLVVEDEENILKLMEFRLKKSGYKVFTARDGESALDLLEREMVDIIIADIMMPKMNGYELVENLRRQGNQLPVIFSTAKEGLSDKAKGFELGIDDYMVKPIEHEELVLRIEAVLKRYKPYTARNLSIRTTTLNYDNLSIEKDNLSVTLTKKEFELLYCLLSSPDHTFTKNELLDKYWGYNNDSYEETLKVHMSRLRNKIKDFEDIEIVTVRGLGYKGVING